MNKLNYHETMRSLLRTSGYLNELYDIKEVVYYSNDIEKLYGCTRDKLLNVVITKQNLDINDVLAERIAMMIQLVEENVILVENIWIEEINTMNNKSNYI
jgi:hypothetical protein